MKRKLKTKYIWGGRCYERLQPNTKEFTRILDPPKKRKKSKKIVEGSDSFFQDAVPVRALCPVGKVIVLSLGWRNSLSSFVEGLQFLCFWTCVSMFPFRRLIPCVCEWGGSKREGERKTEQWGAHLWKGRPASFAPLHFTSFLRFPHFRICAHLHDAGDAIFRPWGRPHQSHRLFKGDEQNLSIWGIQAQQICRPLPQESISVRVACRVHSARTH